MYNYGLLSFPVLSYALRANRAMYTRHRGGTSLSHNLTGETTNIGMRKRADIFYSRLTRHHIVIQLERAYHVAEPKPKFFSTVEDLLFDWSLSVCRPP